MAMHKTAVLAAAGLVLLLAIGGGALAIRSISGSGSRVRTVTLEPSPADSANAANSAVTFSDGSKVECVGIADITFKKSGWVNDLLGRPNMPAPPASWWKPDGSSATGPDLGFDQVFLPASPGRRPLRLVFDTTGVGALGPDVSIRVPNSQGYASSERTLGRIRRTNMAVSLPENADKIDIRIGLGSGAWREDASVTLPTATQPTTRTSGPQMFNNVREENGRVVVDMTIPRNRGEDRDARFAAILKSGKQVMPQEWRSFGGNSSVVTFPCRKDELAKLTWITRPYEWQTIRQVSLKPAAAATQPTTRVAASGK